MVLGFVFFFLCPLATLPLCLRSYSSQLLTLLWCWRLLTLWKSQQNRACAHPLAGPLQSPATPLMKELFPVGHRAAAVAHRKLVPQQWSKFLWCQIISKLFYVDTIAVSQYLHGQFWTPLWGQFYLFSEQSISALPSLYSSPWMMIIFEK